MGFLAGKPALIMILSQDRQAVMVLKNVTAVSVTVTMSLPLSESENETETVSVSVSVTVSMSVSVSVRLSNLYYYLSVCDICQMFMLILGNNFCFHV